MKEAEEAFPEILQDINDIKRFFSFSDIKQGTV